MSIDILKFPIYLIFHPFKAYWELKYERNRKLNLYSSYFILTLLSLVMILDSQYRGFLINYTNPDDVNSIYQILYVVVPVIFWCIANWSLTTLMDGEGNFTEIFISTCYSLVPLILINIPWIWLSNYISMEEAPFYYFSQSIASLWFLFLIFVGNMTVHQFTPLKTVSIMVLTVVAMGFMVFLCLLFFSLIQEFLAFVTTVYQEIAFRI